MSWSKGMSRISTPPKDTVPSVASQKPAISFATVLLPEPEGPTMAVTCPGAAVKLMSRSTCVSPS